MTIVGGLRTRLVHDSLKNMLEDALGDLGWMDSGRRHASVTVTNEDVDAETAVAPNMVGIELYDSGTEEAEMGNSVLTFDTYFYAVHVFAEDTKIGLHLSGDVKDILLGKFSTIGRTGPTLDCYNYQQATPTVFATLDVQEVKKERYDGDAPHQKYWWIVTLMLEDEYGDEAD